MNTPKRAIAVAQLLLMFPSVLFMGALVIRELKPLQYGLAHRAQQVVMWYAVRMWTLWALLIALPFAVLFAGCLTLLRAESNDVKALPSVQQTLAAIRSHRTMKLVAATTATSAAVLVVVVTHMLAN